MDFEVFRVRTPRLLSQLLAFGVLSSASLLAWEVEPGDREVRISTPRLSAVIRDGAVIDLKDLANGRVWADRKRNDHNIPSGLGVLRDLENFRKGHIPWGDTSMKQHLAPDFELSNYLRPVAESKYEMTQDGGVVTLTWRGLSDGKSFEKRATLQLILREGPNGAIAYQIKGENPDGGIFAAACPVVNLTRDSKIVVPCFGGMEYDAEGPAAIMPFGGAPFMEAPILLAHHNTSSLAVWMEDPSMRSFYGFVRRTAKGFGLSMEAQNLMPFEAQRSIETPTFYLQTFDGGWKAAATPFRNWYREHFKNELAVRDNVEWANGIKAIVDIYMTIPTNEDLAKIAEIFPKGSVMFQVWNARAATFDHDLPDWTPRAGYIDGVQRIHDHGFKAMAYVNTYCANYLSPVWERDKLSDFVLTRKNGLWTYKGKSIADTSRALNEKLIGTVDYSSGPDQFANIPEGRLLYTDPLSPRWRQYHADMMKVWNSTTGTDANYEDTAGCVTDGGNGIVEGLSAGEGSVAQMRLLQQTQPQIAMSSEYGPVGIAFGTKWALNYVGHWGHDAFKQYRINHQLPVTTYLFGYRQWISAMMSSDEMRCHAMAASSDATGGLGFSLVDYFLRKDLKAINSTFDWQGHLYQRAKVFVDHELLPYYPDGDYEENVRCLYQGRDGIYSYTDDGKLQRMLDPQGEALYGRVYKATKVKTDLWLANWPLQNGHEIFGMNPQEHYPLFPKPSNTKDCSVTIDSLPEGVMLKAYEEGPGYAYLELAALPNGPKEISLKVNAHEEFAEYFANDILTTAESIQGTLPLRVIALNPSVAKANSRPNWTAREKHRAQNQDLYLHNGSNVRSTFVMEIPAEDTAIEFYLRNLQDKYPFHGYDGSIVKLLVNGQEIKSFDCLPSPKETSTPDTQLRRWNVPMAKYAGRTVLVTVVTDSKANGIQDRQFVSIPKLITSSNREVQEKIYDGKFKVVSNIATPQNWAAALSDYEGGQLISGKSTLFADGSFKIDPNKTYRLSGKFKARQPWAEGNLLFGLAPHDAQSKPIFPIQVNPVKNTETTLLESATAGSTIIKISDASNWKKTDFGGVAFQVEKDLSDLPNRNIISITGVSGQEVTLKVPLAQDYPAGTPIRQHESGNSYMYSGAAYQKVPADKWTEFSGEISGEAASGLSPNQWWKGTEIVRIFMINSQPDIAFKDVRLDEIEY